MSHIIPRYLSLSLENPIAIIIYVQIPIQKLQQIIALCGSLKCMLLLFVADPPSQVLFVSQFPYDFTINQLKHVYPGCTAASIVPKKPKRKPKPKKPRTLTPGQMKKKVVSTRNPTKARKWKPPSDDDCGLGR